MTRVAAVDGPIGGMMPAAVTVEYTVPPDAWYFDETPGEVMPYAVLMEVGLQPCGWLASYIGIARETPEEVAFRNLDGTARVHRPVCRDAGRLVTAARLTNYSRSGSMTIVSFSVTTSCGGTLVHEMETVFGFFPPEALRNQAGLPTTPAEREVLAAPDHLPFLLVGTAWGRLIAGDRSLMVDRITGWWPDGGTAGLGVIRGETRVDPGRWFFKAHFFQDPVQPGSLGIEAMLQLLKTDMLRRGHARGSMRPRFTAIAPAREVRWKYRGQVAHSAAVVVTHAEILARREDAQGVTVEARATTWVDGLKIYEAVVGTTLLFDGPGQIEDVLDPAEQCWIADHCPTYVIPALPLMAMAERLLRGDGPVTQDSAGALCDLTARRWLALPDGPRRVRIGADGAQTTLEAWQDLSLTLGGSFVPVVEATRGLPGVLPAPFAPIEDGVVVHDRHLGPNLYTDGHLFHGPAFRVLKRAIRSARGGTGWLEFPSGTVQCPTVRRTLLLDGVTHVIPNDALELWVPGWSADQVGYPAGLARLQIFAPLGEATMARVEVHYQGADAGAGVSLAFQIWLGPEGENGLWADGVLIYTGLPKGPLGRLRASERRAFLAERRFVAGAGLSRADAASDSTCFDERDLRESDWLPGTIAAVYGCPGLSGAALSCAVVAKDHVGRHLGVHPSVVAYDRETGACRVGDEQRRVAVVCTGEIFTATWG